MDKNIKPGSKLSGSIEVPGDKSISHRALILGAMCPGKVLITNLSSAADCTANANCLKSLGIEIEKQSVSEMIIKGGGLRGFKEPSDILDAHNSGTTVRLLSGLLAAQPFHTVITGDDSLRKRPMKRIIDPLMQMGARITGRENNSMLPMSIIGGEIKSIEYTPPMASAQVKSAVLIAGLYGDAKTIVYEKLQTRDHTERMMEYLGCDIGFSPQKVILGNGKMEPRDITVAGDISSAAFFIVAGVLAKDSRLEIKNVGINPTRTGCLKTLIDMGAEIEIEEIGLKSGEPIGNVKVRSSGLKSINIGTDRIPGMVDEIPILALAATQADGKTVISGARELRFKESDRLHGIASQLKCMGASIEEKPDGLEIEGPTPLTGAEVESFGDHRLAMTLAVAGMLANGETLIRNADCASVSFPEFFEMLDSLRK